MKDKIDRYLDIISDSDNITDESVSAMLKDSELKEIHRLASLAAGAVSPEPEVNINSEWDAFSRRFPRARGHERSGFFLFITRHAAAVLVFCIAALGVVATTIHYSSRPIEAQQESAAIDSEEASLPSVAAASADSVGIPAEAVSGTTVFKNQPLASILEEIAAHYGAGLVFKSESARDLRLFFQWDKGQSLNETIGQLDCFEQLDVKVENGTIVVE